MLSRRRTSFGHLPLQSLGLAALCLAAYALAGPAPEGLVYDREALGAGEAWRLLSAHVMHTDAGHLALNVVALLLLGWLFEPCLGLWLLPTLLAGAAAVDAWLWWGRPGLQLYCGLSGLLNATLAAGLVCRWRAERSRLLALLGLVWLGKTLRECLLDQALFTGTAWPSVPSVHVAGLVAGTLLGLLLGGRGQHSPRS